VPNAHVEARYFWGNEVPLLDQVTAVNIFLGMAFDRNVPLGRQWDARLFAGAGASGVQTAGTDGSRTISVGVQGELGVGNTGRIEAIPYLQVRANALYEACLNANRSTDRHQVCASFVASAFLGFVQLGLDANAAFEYRYRIEDGQRQPRAVVFAGTNASATTLVDLNGAHAAGSVGVGAGVRFQ
jgi:hypothetical protein